MIYVKGSCSQSVMSVTGLIGVLIDGFSGIIECAKERSVNTVVILKA